jgi:FlgN protein
MNAALDNVVDALRNELQQYGELLALLEAQHGSLERHEAWHVLNGAVALDAQRAAVEGARLQRKDAHRRFAWAAGRPDASTFRALHDLVPQQYQALLEALIQDINHATAQIHERVTFNHSLLRRALDRTEQLLATISPQGDSALLAGERNSSGADSSSVTISAAIV